MSVNWGIVGTGNIANAFAVALKVAKKAKLVAVGSRSKQSAVKFGSAYGVPEDRCYPSYDELFNDPEVHAVYICTPHPYHCELAVKGAKAGKHLLVEKPMAMNEKEVMQVINAAKEHDIFFMEAYMYRCHPQTRKLCEVISQGIIGKVRIIRASFSYNGHSFGPESRVWSNELGGGALLDIGGCKYLNLFYLRKKVNCLTHPPFRLKDPMSLARLVAGADNGSSFLNPDNIQATGKLTPTNVDEWTIATLDFADKNIGAQLFTGIFADSDCTAEIIGTEGTLRIANPWRPDIPEMGDPSIILLKPGKSPSTIEYDLLEPNIFAIEADTASEAILAGKRECPFMTWDDSIGQVKALDAWRHQIGLKYRSD
jgi:predicted dehydrogenase